MPETTTLEPLADQSLELPAYIQTLADTDIVALINDTQRYANDRRQTQQVEWDKAWDLYNGVHDFEKKADWQSKIAVPRAYMVVEKAVSKMKMAMSRGDWYSLVPLPMLPEEQQNEQAKAYLFSIQLQKRIMDAWFDYLTLPMKFSQVVKCGYLSHLMILKLGWEEERKKKWTPIYNDDGSIAEFLDEQTIESHPTLNVCDPYFIWLDPTGRDRFIIEEVVMDLSDLRALAEQPGSYYDMDVVNQITEDAGKTDQETQKDEREHMDSAPQSGWRREVRLRRYWGDFWDSEGNLRWENHVACIANNQYLVGRPKPNPYQHGKKPFIVAPLVPLPSGAYHTGPIARMKGHFEALCEIMNLMMDNLSYCMPMFELFEEGLDPGDVESGIHPGKIFRRNAGMFGGPEAQAVRRLDIGQVPVEGFQMYQMMDREVELASAVTENVSGVPSTNRRKTATEVNVYSGESQEMFQDKGEQVQTLLLKPTIQMMKSNVAQFQRDFSSKVMVDTLGEKFSQVLEQEGWNNPAGIEKMLSESCRVEVKGITAMMGRQQQLGALTEMLNALKGMGIPPQAVMNLQEVIGQFMDLMDLDRSRLLGSTSPAPQAAPPGGPGAMMPPSSSPTSAPGSPVPPMQGGVR